MSYRSLAGVIVCVFLLVGVVGWVGNMPKPVDAAADQQLATSPSLSAPVTSSTAVHSPRVDPHWLTTVSGASGIPARVLEAYATAANTIDGEQPSCRLGWNLLAAIGSVESAHGTIGGAHIGPDGELVGTILGPVLDGTAFPAVRDTDGGALDGDSKWDRALGPMQLLPSTWERTQRDGNGDGVADPNDIDDATLTAAAYLCAGGRDLSTGSGWSAAVLSYNHDNAYLTKVRAESVRYAAAAG